MSGKSIVITGATGMVGGIALRNCLEHPDIDRVVTVGRRATGVAHDKLEEVVHGDFEDLSPIAQAMAGHDAALFCLGAYTGSVPDDLFRRITVDYAVGFGRALREHSPDAVYCLLSGQGADRTEKSRTSFARYKGMAENGLDALGFPRFHSFRPAYIYPVTPRDEPNFGYKLSRWLYPAMKAMVPGMVIPSEDLAFAMLHAALHGVGDHQGPTLENKEIRALVARARS